MGVEGKRFYLDPKKENKKKKPKDKKPMCVESMNFVYVCFVVVVDVHLFEFWFFGWDLQVVGHLRRIVFS